MDNFSRLLRHQRWVNNPEKYLSRVQHFSQGLGIPLDQAHPSFGTKTLSMSSTTSPFIHFRVHDEHSMLPHGQHWAAQETLGDASKAGMSRDIGREMNHRAATKVGVTMRDSGISGGVEKYHYDPALSGPVSLTSTGKDFKHPSDYKSALTNVESRWKEINRNRKVDPYVLSTASNLLASPDPKNLQSIKKIYPEAFSSQFLGVYNDHYRDVIDLHTGNWADIDPDGYFPP
jgi:hypothetical protein